MARLSTDEPVRVLQHLLRHLNDFPALRTNAMVASLGSRTDFADGELHARVRAIVARTLEELLNRHALDKGAERARRWHTIIRRCDLNGEPRERVAADLGLCRRQFYRERRAAQESLAGAIVREMGAIAAPGMPAPALAELQIDNAAALRNQGRHAEACRLLENIVATAERAEHKLCALGELVGIYSSQSRVFELEGLLEAARSVSREHVSRDPGLELELTMIEALVAKARGSAADSSALLERVLPRVFPSALPGTRLHNLGLRSALELGEYSLYVGESSETQKYLAVAQKMLARGAANSELHGRYLLLSGEHCLVHGELTKAARTFGAGLGFSRDRGLLLQSIQSLAGLSAACFQGRRWDAARQYAHHALELAGSIDNPSMQASLSGVLCAIEDRSGRTLVALKVGHAARARYSHAGDARGLDLSMARALVRARRGAAARRIFEPAYAELCQAAQHRFLGTAEWIRAELYASVSRQSEAVVATENAIALLHRHGSLYSLGQAYELSGRITGNQRHRRYAREIDAQLTLE